MSLRPEISRQLVGEPSMSMNIFFSKFLRINKHKHGDKALTVKVFIIMSDIILGEMILADNAQ